MQWVCFHQVFEHSPPDADARRAATRIVLHDSAIRSTAGLAGSQDLPDVARVGGQHGGRVAARDTR